MVALTMVRTAPRGATSVQLTDTVGWIVELAFEAYCLEHGCSAEDVSARYDGTVGVDPVTYQEARLTGLLCKVCLRNLADVALELERRRG